MSTVGSGIPELREHDVVCEKGRGDHERWPGNKLYRSLINKYKDEYNDLTPVERSDIIGNISTTIRGKNGWFVQRDETTGKWCELSEEKVRKKVSDDLRREVRRRREKRSNNSMFSAKLKALKEIEEISDSNKDILHPVDDPRPNDVLFGPGARRHPGNKTYWKLMKMNLDQYTISPYGTRSMISRSIVNGIRDQNGRFLEQDPKTTVWYEISDKRAIDKTSHALSNKKYKTRKRHPGEGDGTPIKESLKLGDEASDTAGSATSEPSLRSSDGSRSLAKTMSKKQKLIQRMDGPEFDDDDKESIPHAANILVMGLGSFNKKPPAPTGASPPSPPVTAKKESGIIVTPSDNRSTVSDLSKDDYPEYEGARRMPQRFPSVPEAGVPVAGFPHYQHHLNKTGLGPRLGQSEASYTGEDLERLGYKRVPHPEHLLGEYAAPPRGYVLEAIPPGDYGRSHHLQSLPSYPMERRILQPRIAPGGYWVRDWTSPSARRAEDYAGWR